MQSLINTILTNDAFADAPPVCVDVGASGHLPPDWEPLARHSICVAFDADSRDFAVVDTPHAGWKRLLKINRIVAPSGSPGVEFHLTQSPHCSSTLRPDN